MYKKLKSLLIIMMLIICITVCCSCTSKYDSFVLKAQDAIDEEAYSDVEYFFFVGRYLFDAI